MVQSQLFDKRRVFLILYVVLAGLLLVASYFYSNRLEFNLLDNIYVGLKDKTDQQNEIIRAKIDAQINAVTLLSASIANLDDIDNLHDHASRYGFNDEHDEIFYINKEGIGTAPLSGDIHIATQNYFKDLTEGKTVMTPITFTPSGFTFFIIAPIIQENYVTGYVANEINSTYLYNIISSLSDSDMYMYILDELGNTLALVDNGYALQTRDGITAFMQNSQFQHYSDEFIVNADDFNNSRQMKKSGFIHLNYHGKVRLGYYSPLGISSWSVVSFLPAETISSSAFEIQRNFYILAIISLVVVGLFLFYIVAVSVRNQNLKDNLIRELTTRAEIDFLTKVYTRDEAEARMGTYLKFTHDTDVSALLVIDIDNFEDINITYGDEYGDVLLREIAQGIRGNFRSTDIMGRSEGTQFVVLIHKIKTKELVEYKAKQVVTALHNMILDKDNNRVITASIGIAMCPHNGITYNELYKNADAAMFYAKQNGKNSYVFYDKKQKLNIKRIKPEQTHDPNKDHLVSMEKLESVLLSLFYGTQDTHTAIAEATKRIAQSYFIHHCLIVEYDKVNKILSLAGEYSTEIENTLFNSLEENIKSNQVNIDNLLNSTSTIQEFLSTSEESSNDIARFLGRCGVKSAVSTTFDISENKKGFILFATNDEYFKWQRTLYPSMAFTARLFSIYRKET